jgi:hypothetical protein
MRYDTRRRYPFRLVYIVCSWIEVVSLGHYDTPFIFLRDEHAKYTHEPHSHQGRHPMQSSSAELIYLSHDTDMSFVLHPLLLHRRFLTCTGRRKNHLPSPVSLELSANYSKI